MLFGCAGECSGTTWSRSRRRRPSSRKMCIRDSDRTADIATVAAGAAGAVAVQADGEFIGIGDRVAIDQERNDPLTDWPRDIIGIGYPGIVIVIVVLHLGLQEAIRDPQGRCV